MFDLIDSLKIKPLTSYLSLLLHRHIIQGSKKYTKKCVMMVKMGEKKTKFRVLYTFKKYTTTGCGGCDSYKLCQTWRCRGAFPHHQISLVK